MSDDHSCIMSQEEFCAVCLKRDADAYVAEVSELRATNALLYDALQRLIDAEWMVSCDWTNSQNRDAVIAEVTKALAGVPDKVKELLRDARLGALVRTMPRFYTLHSNGALWWCGEKDAEWKKGIGKTPEDALKAAMGAMEESK